MTRTWLRRLVAMGAAVVAAGAWYELGTSKAFVLPIALLAATTLLVNTRNVGAQLFVRSVWWSSLFLGTLTAIFDHTLAGAVMALAAGTALLVSGRADAPGDPPEGPFGAVAFRRTLLTSLVLAIADAQFLFLWAGLQLEQHERAAILVAAAGAVLLVAVAGLYRLRVWALLLHTAATLSIALAARAGLLHFTPLLVLVWTIMASVQLLLPVPIFVAIVRGRASPSRPSAVAFAAWLALVVLMMASAALALVALRHGWRPV